MSKKQITFGKYAGRDTLWVAKADPEYARWAAGNLRSSMWRREFKRALAAVQDAPAEEIAQARYEAAVEAARRDGQGGIVRYEDFLNEILEEREEAAAWKRYWERYEAEEEEIVRRFAQEAGKPVDQIRSVVHHYRVDWQDAPASRFSSPAMYEMFRRYMAELDALIAPARSGRIRASHLH